MTAVVLLAGVAAVRLLTGSAEAGTVDPGGGWAHAGLPPGTKLSGSARAPIQSHGLRTESIAGFPVSGIDISSHDHSNNCPDAQSIIPLNWAGIAASGAKFAYVKAVEGTDYLNPCFGTDYQAARNNGMYAGAYDFARPDGGDPVGQADYFVENMLWTGDSLNLIPFLDLEGPYGPLTTRLNSCWNLSSTQITTWIRSFLTEVQRRIGRAPMVYTSAGWWHDCAGDDATFGDYPLDLADYDPGPPTTMPAGWSTYAIWQYAGGDRSKGAFDSDVYNGDPAGLATLAGSTPPTVVSLLSHADGQFVTADSGGSKPLIAARAAPATWEQFDKIDTGGGYFALRSHANGRYVTAEAGGASSLVANRMSIGDWEKFQVLPNGDGSVSLKANADGRYVTAEAAGGKPLIANRAGVGPWEEFDLIAPPTVVTLKASANGGYVSADRAGGAPLIANRTAVGSWEQFDRIDLPGGYIALRAHANGLWVTAEAGGAQPLIANRTALGQWERFTLTPPNPDGSVYLRAAANGRYVSGNDGGGPLKADRTSPAAWEEFALT